jgi:hypothetical protein
MSYRVAVSDGDQPVVFAARVTLGTSEMLGQREDSYEGIKNFKTRGSIVLRGYGSLVSRRPSKHKQEGESVRLSAVGIPSIRGGEEVNARILSTEARSSIV